MGQFNEEYGGDVVILVGERDPYVKEAIRGAMNNMRIRTIKSAASSENLREYLKSSYPDYLYVSDDFDENAPDLVKAIRDGEIGKNPFMLITVLMTSNKPEDLGRAVSCGADDVIVKPVSVKTVADRFEKVVFQRQPFIATTDYTGPERRKSSSRKSQIKQIKVLNTLRQKSEGERVTSQSIEASVSDVTAQLAQARMDSHGLKLNWVCQQIMKAYAEKSVTEAVKEHLHSLVEVLYDAGETAQFVGDLKMSGLTKSLAEKVDGISERYQSPTPEDLDLIKKLTTAFMAGLGPKKPPEAPKAEPKSE